MHHIIMISLKLGRAAIAVALPACVFAGWISASAPLTSSPPRIPPAVAPYESPYPAPRVDPSAPPEEPAPTF
ncbi:MAG: hypothetical protein ACOZJX_22350 [Pseudomonadota bacterium]